MGTETRLWILGVVAILLLGAGPAMAAAQAPEVARQSGCLACHGIERKIIGPAFAWVADKYQGDKAAGKQAIIDKIVNGSSGQWIRYTGRIIMPPYGAQTTEAQRNELADFILSLDPIAPPI